MIKNLIITLALYSSLAIGIVKGQQGVIGSYSAEKIIPQSPEVGKFGKYGDYPVNLTSGLVDVTVPIYTIKTKSLELPISISAHLSGIKVDEVASSIGLGWVLNAGGMLSVDVRGARNDSYLSSGVKYKAPDANALAAEEDNGTNYRNKINSYTYMDDTQSDKYTYHVSGGVSGSFVFDNEGKFMSIPISDNKVDINNRYFIVTSAEGKKYYFDRQLVAKTNVSSGMGGSSLNETGYYLTKILSADKRDSIVFEYKSMSPYNNTSVGFVGKRKSEISTTYTPQYFPMKYYDSYTFYEYSLEKIIFNGGEVLFDFRIDREDKGACRLSAIQVNQTVSLNEQTCILRCEFKNSEYFKSPGVISKPVNSIFYNRMKLAGIDIKSCSASIESQSYRFFYNSLMLPNYDLGENQVWSSNSYAQDLWGYYNGKHSNSHLVPFDYRDESEFRKIMNNQPIPDRGVSEKHAKALSLQKIVYPTGGYTIFDLESNRLPTSDLSGGLRVKRVRSYDKNHTLAESREYDYLHGYDISTNGFIPHSSSYLEKYTYLVSPKMISNEDIGKRNQYSETLIYSTSPGLIHLQNSNPVYYDLIAEYNGTKEINTGKTLYTYNYAENSIQGNPGYTEAPRRYNFQTLDKSWRRGDLITKSTFKNVDGTFVELQRVINDYDYYQTARKIIGLVVTQGAIVEHEPGFMHDEFGARREYNWFNTFAETGLKKLIRTTVTEFNDGAITSSKRTEYKYDKVDVINNPHNMLTSEVNELSNGKKRKRYFKYPLDYSYNVTTGADYLTNKKLRDNNVLSTPIEILETISSGSQELVTSGIFYSYKEPGLPSNIYSLEIDTPFSYTGANTISGTGYNKSEKYKLATGITYDVDNNVVELFNNEGIKTSFLWGYKSNYPIAKFENVSFLELESAITNLGFTYYSFLNDTKTDQSKISLLRTKLPNAKISMFSYAPLIGTSSVVDQKEQKTTYKYDAQNKLKSIIDQNDKVVKAFEYHMEPNSLELRLYTENQYYQYRLVSFDAEVLNGSGNYQYEWKLLGATGNIIGSSVEPIFTVTPSILGSCSLQCKITDLTKNRTHQTTRNLNVVSAPLLEVSEISSNNPEYRVNGRNTLFSIAASEGSLDYRYNWSLQTPTKTITGTLRDFQIKLEETGNMVLKCIVTDNKTSESISRQFSFTSLAPNPVVTSVRATKTPVFGDNVWFNMDLAEGSGSGNFTAPSWTVTTPTKIVNYSGAPFQYIFDEKGTYKIKGCVTDLFTGINTCAEQNYVIKPGIGFSDVLQSSSGSNFTLNAKIFSVDAASVTFELALDRTQSPLNNNATFIINGQSNYLMSGSKTVTIPLKKGDNAVSIIYTKTAGVMSVERASITITAAPSDYTISSNKVTLNAL